MEYNWKPITKKSRGAANYRPKWVEIPCISINKSAITLNRKFCEEYINGSCQVQFMVDKDNQVLGIKLVPRGDEQPSNWTIQDNGTSGKRSHTKKIVTREPAKTFPESVGRAYRTSLAAPGSKMHVVSITESNRIS